MQFKMKVILLVISLFSLLLINAQNKHQGIPIITILLINIEMKKG